MDKKDIKNGLLNHLDNNYKKIAPYYNQKPVLFKELILNTFEINRCLIIGASMASITLTNYLLERLLKTALMADENKFLPIEAPWEENLKKTHLKYIDIDIYKAINLCCSKGLISKAQKNKLHIFRNQYRNGFSHSSSDLILNDVEIPYPLNDIRYEIRMSPDFQALELYNFAKSNALPYYDYVFHLIFDIENRLKSKYVVS